jgi:hypothetical protein
VVCDKLASLLDAYAAAQGVDNHKETD